MNTVRPASSGGRRTAAHGLLISLACLLPIALLAETSPEPAVTLGPPAQINASYRMDFTYRQEGDHRDRDLSATITYDARDLRRGLLDIYMSARLHEDLDSPSTPSQADDPFFDIQDAKDTQTKRILQMYADLHDREQRTSLKLGRQYIEIADYLHLDGAQMMWNERGRLGGRVYAGRPVSYYDSMSGHYAGGVSLIGRPWEGNQTRLTLGRYHDDDEDADDNHYFIDVRQEITEQARIRGQLSILNDEYRMGRLDWYSYTPGGETDFSAGVSYWGAFDAQTRLYSPLYNVLGEQDPYTIVYARLTQQIIPSWFLAPGVSLRFAEQSNNEFSNRDYQNYDLSLIYAPNRTFNATVTYEYWNVEEGDRFSGVSGELRYRHGRVWEISGGAAYAKYTYNTFSDFSYIASGGQTVFTEEGTIIQESPYVITYFIRGRWRITPKWMIRLQFDVEDNDAIEDVSYRGRGTFEVRF